MLRKDFRGMKYRRCGASGLWLSEIGLGLWKWGDPAYDGSRIGEHEGFRVLDRALELGITHWDTANSYNAGSGNSERLLGRFFAARGGRERDMVVVATKVRNSVRDEHEASREFSPNQSGASRKYIMRAVEDCLRRLQTDRIDLLYHHAPNLTPEGAWETPLEETWQAFADLVRQGKVVYLAVSNRSRRQLEEEMRALTAVSGGAGTRLIALQNRYNLVDRNKVAGGQGSEREMLAFLREQGVGLVPMVPLAVGFLTGRYRRGATDAGGRLASEADASWAREYLTDRNYAILDALQRMASQKGCSIAQLAIAWLLAHEEISSVIAGVTRIEQMEDNAGAARISVEGSELAELDRLSEA